MNSKINFEWHSVSDLTPYEQNAREHGEPDIGAIKKSIQEFGFNDPIGIWGDSNLIVEGHGRLIAAKELGMTEVPCIRLDHLTDEERKAYALAHNKTAELSEWDFDKLDLELAGIKEIDMSAFGFDVQEDWFRDRKRYDDDDDDESDEYKEFVRKFEIKKTTDDCYTPDLIYETVAAWVSEKYGVEKTKFVRPFYPGGDYEKEKYEEGCVVVDNPPFSIFSEIIKFYTQRNIKFFLFAPSVTVLNYTEMATAVALMVTVAYENGAKVPTSFVTNLEDINISAKTEPELYKTIAEANKTVQKELTREISKYAYPDNIVTAAMMGKYSKYGVEYTVNRKDAVLISALDEQKEEGKGIYGRGLLLSERAAAERAAAERAAAERAAAERAAAHCWALSERELEIVRNLGDQNQMEK